MSPTVVTTIVAFALVAAVLWPIERRWPAIGGRRFYREGLGTDLAYWLFTPLITRWLTRLAVTTAVILLALRAGVPLDGESIRAWASGTNAVVRSWPIALQVLAVLLLGDVVGYWMHRLFHGRSLWRFHAVHHSSTEVDWLSSVRLHPVNDVLSRVAQVIPVLLLGFPATILAAYVPFLTFYALLLHANVPWTFGPLRYVLASPAFHRWHHTTRDEGLDKNFAGLFPFIDLLFGSFHMPPDRQPSRFGIRGGEPVPPDLLGQLVYPFRKSARPLSRTA